VAGVHGLDQRLLDRVPVSLAGDHRWQVPDGLNHVIAIAALADRPQQARCTRCPRFASVLAISASCRGGREHVALPDRGDHGLAGEPGQILYRTLPFTARQYAWTFAGRVDTDAAADPEGAEHRRHPVDAELEGKVVK
jgi:hypothetical protein